MFNPATNHLFEIFAQSGVKAYIVGGAVRNHLLEQSIKDIDFATQSTPEQNIQILDQAEIHHIPTGLKHGTITALIHDEPFEITSFRKDIITNGRQAEVIFGGTIEEDALRRDFTINALYMDQNQNILDPLGGLQDIRSKTLRFVGTPEKRVREDYLRILRFYRFLAQYNLTPEEKSQAACQKMGDALKNISAERIGAEMRLLLEGHNRIFALDLAQKGETLQTALPNFTPAPYTHWVEYLQSDQLTPDWRVEAYAAGGSHLKSAWRLSNADAKFIQTLKSADHDNFPPAQMGEIYGSKIGLWALHLRAARSSSRLPKSSVKELEKGASLIFPINGQDLLEKGFQNKEIGDTLKQLKSRWRLANYEIDKEELLASIEPKQRPK